MKNIVLTSSSSTKSTSFGDRSETRDSCYFPGCRKDTNCNCDICLASINATLDLMPSSAQHSSLTKLSTPEITPILFDPLIPSTPPLLHSTAKSRPVKENKKKEKGPSWISWSVLLRFLLGVSLIFSADSGFSWVVSGVLRPLSSHEKVMRMGEESGAVGGLDGRLGFLQKKIGEVVHGKVSNCSAVDSVWELNQDGYHLVYSRCLLYKSRTEEVSIWGWPLQTAGLLMTGFTSRSYTILSGRITEWSEGKMRFSVHNSNSSWVQQKWSASALQLDPNTWVLEYRQNAILENSRLSRAAMELLRYRFWKVVQCLKQGFLALITLPYHYYQDYNYYRTNGDSFRYYAT